MSDESLEQRRLRLAAKSNALALRPAGPSAAAAPGPALIEIPFNCSTRRLPYSVVNQEANGVLTPLRAELPRGGGFGGGMVGAPAALGIYRFAGAAFPACPHCAGWSRAPLVHSWWVCGSCGGYNCPGSDGQGRYHCGCGLVVTGGFETAEQFAVHGTRSSAAPPLIPRAALPHSAPAFALPSRAPALAAPRPVAAPSSVPRVGYGSPGDAPGSWRRLR
jgi:hypothetical protein